MRSIYQYLVIRWAATHPLSALQNVDMIINGLAKGGFLTMGTKRVGLARTQALIENLKRSLNLNGATLTDCKITTSKEVTLSGDTEASGQLKLTGNDLATTAGAGITGGTGTVCKSTATYEGGLIVTRIVIDLTGLVSDGAAKDIIGKTGGTANCHLGQITAARCGTIFAGTVQCIEEPNSLKDFDLWESSVATGAEGTDASTLTDAARLMEADGNFSEGSTKGLSTMPTADHYLYLADGGGSSASFTKGQFIITLYGTE